jgi:hypothetical protein
MALSSSVANVATSDSAVLVTSVEPRTEARSIQHTLGLEEILRSCDWVSVAFRSPRLLSVPTGNKATVVLLITPDMDKQPWTALGEFLKFLDYRVFLWQLHTHTLALPASLPINSCSVVALNKADAYGHLINRYNDLTIERAISLESDSEAEENASLDGTPLLIDSATWERVALALSL